MLLLADNLDKVLAVFQAARYVSTEAASDATRVTKCVACWQPLSWGTVANLGGRAGWRLQ